MPAMTVHIYTTFSYCFKFFKNLGAVCSLFLVLTQNCNQNTLANIYHRLFIFRFSGETQNK